MNENQGLYHKSWGTFRIIGNLEVTFVKGGGGDISKLSPGRFFVTTTLNKTTWKSSEFFGKFEKCSKTFVRPSDNIFQIFENLRKMLGNVRKEVKTLQLESLYN